MEDEDGLSMTTPTVEFTRKLNRDPDKSFEKFSRDVKVSVSSLRSALEQAKHRIVRLRDENDKKDDIIEEERNHRLALEDKLEKYLVDLYQSPNVNDELHQRLPRAKKKGLLFRKEDDQFKALDSEHDADSESSVMGPDDQREESDVLNKESLYPSMKAISSNQQDSSTGDGMISSETIQQSLQHKNDQQSVPNPLQSSSQSSFPGPVPPGAFAIPQYTHYLYPTQLFPHLQPNPLSSASATSFASSSYVGLPSVTNPEAMQESTQHNTDHNPQQSAPSPRNANQNHTPSHVSAAKSNNNFVHPLLNQIGSCGVVPPFNQTQIPMSLLESGFINTQEREDNVSHLTRLLQENSVLKREIKELKGELNENKRDLELLKLNVNQDNENKNADAIEALIEEVKRAEKAGEKAVSRLIQSASDDRDAALHELDRMKLKAAKKNLSLPSISQTEMSSDETENDMADMSVSSEHEYVESVKGETRMSTLDVERLMERQREISRQEMGRMIAQRDEALNKVCRLQRKLSSIKLSDFPGVTNQKLLAKLKIVEKERDMAVGKLKLMSQDMNDVTLLYNLQKALFMDDVNIDSNNIPSSKWPNNTATDKKTTTSRLESHDKEDIKLLEKLKSLEREKAERDKTIENLQELVMRQRKKLNTLCAGPLLMDD